MKISVKNFLKWELFLLKFSVVVPLIMTTIIFISSNFISVKNKIFNGNQLEPEQLVNFYFAAVVGVFALGTIINIVVFILGVILARLKHRTQ